MHLMCSTAGVIQRPCRSETSCERTGDGVDTVKLARMSLISVTIGNQIEPPPLWDASTHPGPEIEFDQRIVW